MKASIQLYFSSQDSRIQLDELIFEHPLLENTLHSLRGRAQIPGFGVFTWSSAVSALCLLFLQSRVNRGEARPGIALLQGNKGTAASSLDYAISKKPNWILDMFGTDSHGQPILRRLISRRNSEMKRPGPVSLYLNSNVHVDVFLNGDQCISQDSLSRVQELLSRRSKRLSGSGEGKGMRRHRKAA